MDAAEGCKKTEVIAIMSFKIEKCYVRGLYVKLILHILLVYSVHISYTWSTVYEKQTNRILIYYILGEHVE